MTLSSRNAYFESLYADQEDPYGVRHRWYEQRKRALVLASLPHRQFGSAYEPGCGTGELTAELAGRCEALLASDGSLKALASAHARNGGFPHVTLEHQVLPEQWPTQHSPFDLIVLSELGYFLDEPGMKTIARRCASSLSDAGVLVACDWKPDFDARVLSTDQVHAVLASIGLRQIVLHEEDDFVLRLWAKDARSVAQQEGIR